MVEVDDVDALLLIAKVVLGNTELLNYCGETKLAEKDKMLQICWRNQFDTNPILRGTSTFTLKLNYIVIQRQFKFHSVTVQTLSLKLQSNWGGGGGV